MLKNHLKIAILALFTAATLAVGGIQHAKAFTVPSFSLTPVGTDSIQITASGDEYTPVQLYYYNDGFTLLGTIGTTNSAGYFSETVPFTQFNIASGVSVYVLVDGAQSQTLQWPYYSGSYGGVVLGASTVGQSAGYVYPGNGAIYTNPGTNVTPIYFSQNNLSMSVGQTQTINLYGQGGYYVSNPSNSYVASASVNGSSLFIYANSGGTANITVCETGGSCAVLYVTVASVSPIYNQTIYPQPTYYQQPYYQSSQVVTHPVYTPPTYSYPVYNNYPTYSYPTYTYNPYQYQAYVPPVWRY